MILFVSTFDGMLWGDTSRTNIVTQYLRLFLLSLTCKQDIENFRKDLNGQNIAIKFWSMIGENSYLTFNKHFHCALCNAFLLPL